MGTHENLQVTDASHWFQDRSGVCTLDLGRNDLVEEKINEVIELEVALRTVVNWIGSTKLSRKDTEGLWYTKNGVALTLSSQFISTLIYYCTTPIHSLFSTPFYLSSTLTQPTFPLPPYNTHPWFQLATLVVL